MRLEITPRARKYGYIIWPSAMDETMKQFLRESERIILIYMNTDHGEKRVDWTHRRISIGYRWTRNLPQNKKYFYLHYKKPNRLIVE